MSASSEYLSTLTRLTEAKANAQAEAASQSGRIWGNTIANIGQMVSQYPEQQAQLQAMKQRAEIGSFELQKARQQQQDEAAVKIALQESNGDLDVALPKIMAVSPTAGLAFKKQIQEGREKAALTHKNELEGTEKALQIGTQWMSQANDQDSYTSARQRIATLDPTIAQALPDAYDPDVVKRFTESTMTAADRARVQNEAMNRYLEMLKFQAGTPERMKKATEFFGQYLSASHNPEDWDAHIRGAPLMGVPPEVVKQFPAQYSPDAVKQAAELAMSPEERQRVANTASDNARADAAAAEIRRHNRVTEARLGATAAAANAPAIEIKPGTREYRIAQDLASGKLTMADFNRMYGRAASNANLKASLYDQARQFNPDFNPAQFELGFKMAGSPSIRQRVVAINALGPVIDRVEALSEQAGNGGVPVFNQLVNAAKFQLGDQTITNFRQMQILLGDEVGMALGLGTGSDLKTKLGIDLVNPNLSPANFKATMEQLRSVLNARRNELYKTMGVYGTTDTGGAGSSTNASVPAVGSTFQGGKVLKVTPVP